LNPFRLKLRQKTIGILSKI